MAHFNKRHYEAIAQLMQDQCPNLPRIENYGGAWGYNDEGYDHDALGRQLMWDDMIEALADTFKRDNNLFNRDRFLHACKPGSNVKARTAHLRATQ